MELLIQLMDNFLTVEDGIIDKRLMVNLLKVRASNY